MMINIKPISCFLAVIAVSPFLIGCEHPVDRLSNGMPLPSQTFEHIEKISLNVADIQIFRATNPTPMPESFVVGLEDRALLYLSKKFTAHGVVGRDGHLVASIQEASVLETEKDSSSSLLSKVGLDKVHMYDMTLVMNFEHQDQSGRVIYGKTLRVKKRFGISEHDSPASREQKQFKAVEDMFDMLDPDVNRVVKADMNL